MNLSDLKLTSFFSFFPPVMAECYIKMFISMDFKEQDCFQRTNINFVMVNRREGQSWQARGTVCGFSKGGV